ncbi:unnamed protein product [Tilletia controversa]|uniref:Uncharacterized protein n=1 Tax=Tilletia controversa TaxID=13291 RepID=A0A8X7MMK4_9BASI|nr:hypothetical protein A4X06_0g7069 [Tilletia controversa]CAD6931683.1 unnamed protein product [Tilletia controversa]
MADALDDTYDFSDNEDGGSGAGAGAGGSGAGQPKAKAKDSSQQENKRRKRQLLRARTRQKRDITLLCGLDKPELAFGQYPDDVQANYLASIIKKHSPDLSPLEYSEYPLGTEHLLDLQRPWQTLLSSSATATTAANIGIARFIQHTLAPTVEQSLTPPSSACNRLHGAPAILVITADAGRAATLCIEIAAVLETQTGAKNAEPKAKKAKHEHVAVSSSTSNRLKPAKLFGRHFKADDQRAYLETNPTPIAVGTPARIRALLDPPAATTSTSTSLSNPTSTKSEAVLNLDHLEYVIIDISFKDKRGRNLFESDDARPETLPLLAELWKRRKESAAAARTQQKEVGGHDGKKKRKTDEAGDAKSRASSLKRWLVMY